MNHWQPYSQACTQAAFGRVVARFLTWCNRDVWQHQGATGQLLKDSTAHPYMGERVRKGTLNIACPSHLVNLPRLTYHTPCGRFTRNKQKKLLVGAWNVCTLLDRDNIARPERRTALIAKELARYRIDIAALSETRLADEGTPKEYGEWLHLLLLNQRQRTDYMEWGLQ